MHYIYLIEATGLVKDGEEITGETIRGTYDFDTHMCKIGVSSNPKKRKRQLASGCPSALALIFTYKVPDEVTALWTEAWLHRIFCHRRRHGEWFLLYPWERDEEAVYYIDFLLSDEFCQQEMEDCGLVNPDDGPTPSYHQPWRSPL